MKISEVHIDGFGTWKDLSLGEFGDGVTVIYGPNEAGKTTLMQFMRTMLYGFSPQRRSRYLPPVNGGRPGGAIAISKEGGVHRVVRHAGLDDPSGYLGDVTVVSPDGAAHGQSHLDGLLAGVDEPTFNNVFALGLREIQELGTLDDTAASDHLYRLTGGLDRVSLIDVVRELQSSRQRILGWHDKPAEIAPLIARRDKLREEQRELATRTDRWLALAAQRSELVEEAEHLDSDIAALEQRVRVMEVAMQARDLWTARREIDGKLTKLGKPKQVRKKYIDLLKKFNERIAKAQTRIAEIKAERAKVLEEIKSIKVNHAIWNQASRIEALTENSHWVATLETQVEKLRNELRGHETSLQSQAATAGAPGFDVSLANQQTIAQLRRPSRAIAEEEERHESAKRLASEAKAEYDALVQKIEQRLIERNETDLQTAIQNAGERIQLLRRRMQIDQRIDQFDRHREDLESYRDDLFNRHVMPMWTTVGLGVVFATGVMLALVTFAGNFLDPPLVQQQQGPIMLIGVVLAALAAGGKVGLERQTTFKLDAVRKQLSLVNRQLNEVKEQREQIDESLPRGGGALDVRLTRAEDDLKRLEELLPLQTQREILKQKADAAARHETDVESSLKEARSRWKASLRALGLPENFSLGTLRQHSQKGEEITHTRRQVDVIRDELSQRERELFSLAARIDQLMGDIRLKPETDRPQDRLAQLTKALEHERDQNLKKGDHRRTLKDLRKELDVSLRLVRRDGRSRELVFDKVGVRNEKQFDRAVQRYHMFRVLGKRREALTLKIIAALATRITEDELDAELLPHDEGTVELRRENALFKIRDWRVKLGQIHEKRGQVQQELTMLADDRRLEELKVELAVVQRQIADQVRRWQVLAATEVTLTSVRKIYETHRQPETLREASEYLKELTSGHYVRIWTPLEDRTLCIDDASGKSLRLEVLSRGTREAIFLALRLSLLNSFARRGAKLPLILDDVLVNFDTGRVKAAAAVLRDFAKTHGHQILMFTCHEHIMKLFRAAKVDVRTLPGHELPVEEIEKPKRKKPDPTPEPVLEIMPLLLPAPPPPKAEPAPVIVVEQPAESIETIPDFHEFSVVSASDYRSSTHLWSSQFDDVYGVDEIKGEKLRRAVPRPAAPPAVTFEPIATYEPVATYEPPPPSPRVRKVPVAPRPLPQRRQRFAWESPERYVDENGNESMID